MRLSRSKETLPKNLADGSILARKAIGSQDFSIISENDDLSPKEKLYLAQAIIIRLIVTDGHLEAANNNWQWSEYLRKRLILVSKIDTPTTIKIGDAVRSLHKTSADSSFVSAVFTYAEEHKFDGNMTNDCPVAERIALGGETLQQMIRVHHVLEGFPIEDIVPKRIGLMTEISSKGIDQSLNRFDKIDKCPVTGKVRPSQSLKLKFQSLVVRLLNRPIGQNMKRYRDVKKIGTAPCPAATAAKLRPLATQAQEDIINEPRIY